MKNLNEARKKEYEEFEIKQTEILKDIPEEFHAFLRHEAWDGGHACGYIEVLNILNGMVGGIKEAIKNYNKRYGIK